jgi:dTDP-4-amino-4,6-dideoxygalactose transaminase
MPERRVPLFDMAAELNPIRSEIDAAIARVLDSGALIHGPDVAAFERELASVVGTNHAIGVSSGTDALLAILMALDIGPGDEVITTPLTFFATAGSAARLGARVVFADIDDNRLTLDPSAVTARITARTKAVIPVHLYGLPAAIPTVPCPVIEDAAQSIGGARLRGLAAAYSFFPTKNLGAIGDAGAVVTNDADLADRVTLLRTQGARPKYHHLAVGGNLRLDTLQAAVLRAKLHHLEAWNAARRGHAARYRQLLASAKLPADVRLPADDPDHVFHQFVIRVPRRDALRAHLAASNIGTEIYYPEPLHLQPAFADLGYRVGSMPNAERACHEVLALPIRPGLSIDDQALVVERIAAFFAGGAR